ncbi:hypothetical protein [Garicola koreensis]|uniref:Secreted protein n=1 Tax=Garicola koreensis TaxID=1262554 RepID=A0A7W5TQU3_9MICC|nr:hypothetical protein [Garicola koreensis]MBB3666912.1 hypothetical protein [Garicola koreensis]
MSNRNLRTTLAAAALAVVGMLAAGCSAEDPGPQSEPTEPTQTASAEASAETETTKAEAESSGEWDKDGDWNAEWDENRPESAKAGDTYHLADGTTYTHAEMKAKREDPEPTFDSTPVEDIAEDDLPITEGSFSAEKHMEVPEPVTPNTCTDPEAIEANEGHEPAGWPAGVAEGEELPDPECHPDFIELPTWEHYHSTCMDPIAHGTALPPEHPQSTASEEEYRSFAWEASQMRSWWTPPAEGEDCYGHEG